mgnify:CR=1 FL=1
MLTHGVIYPLLLFTHCGARPSLAAGLNIAVARRLHFHSTMQPLDILSILAGRADESTVRQARGLSAGTWTTGDKPSLGQRLRLAVLIFQDEGAGSFLCLCTTFACVYISILLVSYLMSTSP